MVLVRDASPTSKELAEAIGLKQQSIHTYIVELSNLGLIQKKKKRHLQFGLSLTNLGREAIKHIVTVEDGKVYGDMPTLQRPIGKARIHKGR